MTSKSGKIAAFALLLILSVTLLATLFLVGKKQILKNFANSENQVNLVLELTKEENGQIKITEANTYQGAFIPKSPPNALNTHTLEQVVDDKVVYKSDFFFNTEVPAPPPLPGETLGDPPAKITKPTITLSIPFNRNAKLQTRNIKSLEKTFLDMTRVNLSLANIKQVSRGDFKEAQESSFDNYLDIIMIANNYTDFNSFQNDANSIANFFKTVPPYSSYAEKIRFHPYENTTDLECVYGVGGLSRLLVCKTAKVLNAAANSGLPYDTILVIENNNNYGGSGPYGQYAVTYRDVSALANKVAVHEFSHSWGFLNDEYDYGYSSDGSPLRDNCSQTPCKWDGVEGTGCFPGCAYTDTQKSNIDECLMGTLNPNGGFHYDNVDEPSIRGRLNSFSPIQPGSPNPENSNQIWTTNWCVSTIKQCLDSGLVKPAYFYDTNSCSSETPYICSGYQNSEGNLTPTPIQTPPPTPTPSPKSSIQGFVFKDENGNAIKNPDPNDPDINNVKIPLYQVNSTTSTYITTVNSSYQGSIKNYSFANLKAGNYQFGRPKIPNKFAFETCSKIKPPKTVNIPKSNHYFYCEDLNEAKTKTKLFIMKWTPTAKRPFKETNPSFIVNEGEITFVDVPLVSK